MGRRWNAVALSALFCCAASCTGASSEAAIVPVASPPPAAQVLAAVATPADFQITYRTHHLAEGPLTVKTAAYVQRTWSGSGRVVLEPGFKASLHETNTFCADGCPVDEIVDGTDRYTKAPGTSWSVDHGIGLENYYWSAILPSTLRQATDARLVGAQSVGGHDAWVVDARIAGQAFRLWLRRDDGYPLRATSSPNAKTPYVDIEIDATDFDRGLAISVPTREQLNPLYWGPQYRPEEPIPLDGGSVTVGIQVKNCHGGPELYDELDSGFFDLVPFTYRAAAKAVAVDPAAWRVYDAFGRPYPPVPQGVAAALVAKTVPPGQSRSGALCFLLPFNENEFALVGDLPGGLVVGFIGGVLLPDSSGVASPI